ncbi:hypothetical protein SNOG_14298 [Parastagonospora nodorum SN15]|uniref:TOG domain-containing protein n=1 Tax=Phaeosphaeria nodorum (strain SN15 / ATCC MYA-4574 / FGSC 10173) TaxID=321614 RepID=Q0U1A9_PHANO|nr:hypothetical protein SNOG_14298 [Parastagonospora nodorum SN15]EAT78169.1 hypothetical protein SNOG_14298 [Parastagonospora nodorum SN15]
MADQEEDFSALPLPDRFTHKNWKVRKEAYEAAAKEFSLAASESEPIVRQFVNDASIWKGVVGDSNVAAQQEGLGALCAFLEISGHSGCTRTRQITIATIAEKGLPSTRPAAKQKALEALMLYIETDKADPVIEELLPILSHKQPKVIAATLEALTQIYHAYGCKTIEPKPVLKALPKMYGHADKNVRARAQELTVEFYRWLKEAMKPLFWNDLKPVQQTDLDKLFEKVKDEPPPKQERLLRSQQAAKEAAAAAPGADEDYEEEEEEAAIDLEPEFEAVDVFPNIPKDYNERLGSSKWKDRKEVLEEVQKALNHPKIAEGPFDDLIRGFAKSMKDANIAVVSTAANCVELLATGLKKSFARYRKEIMGPMMERLKEKKQAVTDAIGGALDAVFASTNFQDCLEEILEFLKHKNPQVKLESTRFLIRSLKATREAPTPEQAKAMAEASTKLLTESQEIHELQNQNAQLIEDHTRDVLSIKAKETQLVRARSDYEAAEQTVQNQRREVDRLKRELSRQVRATSPPPTEIGEQIYTDNTNGARLGDSGYGNHGLYGRRERSFASGPGSPGGDGKENFDALSRPSSNLSGKLSPRRADASGKSSISSRGGGRMSPAENGIGRAGSSQAASGAESWKRAAEVTQNLKQRIEMMKAKQGIGRTPQQ